MIKSFKTMVDEDDINAELKARNIKDDQVISIVLDNGSNLWGKVFYRTSATTIPNASYPIRP